MGFEKSLTKRAEGWPGKLLRISVHEEMDTGLAEPVAFAMVSV